MKKKMLIVVMVTLILPFGCFSQRIKSSIQIEKGKSNFLKDRKGKIWDISHAVKVYNFNKSYFRYGLGLGVIAPIDHPHFISPGERDYPTDNEDFELIGVVVDGIARAYPLKIMIKHETVNDLIGKQWLAVAY